MLRSTAQREKNSREFFALAKPEPERDIDVVENSDIKYSERGYRRLTGSNAIMIAPGDK